MLHAEGAALGGRHRHGRRLLRRLLEGRHLWGELEVWSSRYGYTTYCLVVYPPGSTAAERIRFRALRSWAPLGFVLSTFTVLLAGQALPFAAALGTGIAVYAAGALLLACIAGPNRRLIRTLQTCRGNEGIGGLDRGPQDLPDGVIELLLESERQFEAGETDAVDYEAAWGRAWQVLGAFQKRGF